MTTMLRPGQRMVHLPGIGITTSRRAVSAATANWWEAGGATGCVAAYQPKGAASLAASYVNLANPGTYDAAPGTAPTWNASTGWTGDGSTTYLTTGVTPGAGWSMLVSFSSITGSRAMLAGEVAANAYFALGAKWYGFGARALWAGGEAYQGPELSSGVMALAGNLLYINGVYKKTISSTWTGSPAAIYLLAQNQVPTSGNNIAGNLLACAIYNTALNGTQVAAVSTAMAAL